MHRNTVLTLLLVAILCCAASCSREPSVTRTARPGEPDGFVKDLCAAALERTKHTVFYESAYRVIPYPGGDVAINKGVCTDVVIRSYRKLGIDLQKEVHEEMRSHFAAFPKKWGLKEPDTNIDHRRVPNLQVFFSRRGEKLPVTKEAQDYQPGDLVTWGVFTRPHIGIVVDRISRDGKRFMVVHNIGMGPKLEDMLCDYCITGRYRYYGSYAQRRTQGARAVAPEPQRSNPVNCVSFLFPASEFLE